MVRRRYDGALRNPYDEAECGHHYARAMASWGLVHAVPGIDYDGRTVTMSLTARRPRGHWFWAVDGAWGSLDRESHGPDVSVVIEVRSRGADRTLVVGHKRVATGPVGEDRCWVVCAGRDDRLVVCVTGSKRHWFGAIQDSRPAESETDGCKRYSLRNVML